MDYNIHKTHGNFNHLVGATELWEHYEKLKMVELPKDYGQVDVEINGKKLTLDHGDEKILDKWLKTFKKGEY